MAIPQPQPEVIVDVGLQRPWLLHGETTQGFMTVGYLPTRRIADVWNRKSIPRVQLIDYL
jgi:hypothetical protein